MFRPVNAGKEIELSFDFLNALEPDWHLPPLNDLYSCDNLTTSCFDPKKRTLREMRQQNWRRPSMSVFFSSIYSTYISCYVVMLHLLCSQLSVCVWKGGIQINVINRSTAREMFRLMGLDVASSCLKDSIEKKGYWVLWDRARFRCRLHQWLWFELEHLLKHLNSVSSSVIFEDCWKN